MAYFRENELEQTKRQPALNDAGESGINVQDQYIESDYDDGFDEPYDDAEDSVSEEEQNEIRKQRFRIATGAWNLIAVIGGTIVILLLLAFLLQMVGFVLNDADRNFTMFQTRF